MRYFWAVFLPPVAVLLCGKPVQFILNIFLTLCLWIPGMIHAILIVADTNAKARNDRVVAAVERGRR